MMETNQQQQHRQRHHSSQQGHPQPPPHRQSHKWHHAFSSFCLTFWLLIIMALLLGPVTPEVIYRVDPLALLAATLRTYQRAGCDSEQLALSCPRGTSISIELAQYGRAGDLSDHSLCPPISEEDFTTTGSAGDGGVIHSGTQIEVKPPETCTVSGLQYALLQTVVDTCQKKRHCKFAANPKSLSSGDPCSGVRKFVEIAYKCRPYEFRSKVACENDNMPLVCNPYSRIAIYSASFGHTEKESVQCGGVGGGGPVSDTGDQSNVKQTCLVSYATETVMQICHGRRRCSVTADAGTFGRPCKNDVRMYLKVVYTCIPRKVLKDRYETAPEADEPQQSELDMDQDELYDEDQFYKESEAIPPAPKLQGAIPNHGGYPYDFNDASISRGAGGGGGSDGGTTTLIPPLLSRNDSSLEDGLRLGSAFAWFHRRPASATPSPSATEEAPTSDSPIEEVPWQARIADVSPDANRNVFYKRHPCPDEASVDCTPTIERVEVVGFLVDWIRVYQHIRKNQEEFYLYLIISVVLGVLLCLTLVIGRLALQRKRSSRKNSSSSGNAAASKSCNDTGSAGGGGGGGKYPQTQSGDMNLPNSFGDDISDIDADIDLTSPMPVVSSLPSRNETYLSYAPTSACTYGSLQPQSTATTLLMPSSTHPGGLLMSSHNPNQNELKAAIDGCSGQSGVGGGVGQSRQSSPSPAQLYTSMGICSPTVSGTMTMGSSHVLAPSTLNSMAQGTSYLSTGPPMMVPGTGHHQHMPHVLAGTLRRTYIPTSMGIMGGSVLPTQSVGLTGMPGGPSSTSGGIYYDSTVPRGTMNRGMSVDNNAQYFYG